MQVVDKDRFFAVVGPLDVCPKVDQQSLKGRFHVSRWETRYSRTMIGETTSDSWGIVPTTYTLARARHDRDARTRRLYGRASISGVPRPPWETGRNSGVSRRMARSGRGYPRRSRTPPSGAAIGLTAIGRENPPRLPAPG